MTRQTQPTAVETRCFFQLNRIGSNHGDKEAYQKKLAAQLKEWDAKLDLWSAKAQKATADARIIYENELESLKSKRTRTRRSGVGKRSETPGKI